jgi:hypothetical protein
MRKELMDRDRVEGKCRTSKAKQRCDLTADDLAAALGSTFEARPTALATSSFCRAR